MEDNSQLERELFGSSSSEEEEEQDQGIDFDNDDDDDQNSSSFDGSRLPNGLSLHRGALSSDTSKTLFDVLRAILDDKTQAFFFGLDSFPPWALALSNAAASHLLASSWPKELTQRVPLFNMAAINLYSSPGEEEKEAGAGKADDGGDDSLRQHVDLDRFSDGVAVFSLGTPAVMRFEEINAGSENSPGGVASVLLRDGDLLAMRGEARWEWTHGFASGDHFFKGEEIVRRGGARIGVTLRRMKGDEEGGGGRG